MNKLNRIASALERIAEALEGRFHSGGIGGGLREGEIPAILSSGYDAGSNPTIERADAVRPPHPLGSCRLDETFGIDYSMMGDDKTADTCRATFDGMPNFGKSPDTQSTHINIKCRNANEFREQYMQQPKVDDSE